MFRPTLAIFRYITGISSVYLKYNGSVVCNKCVSYEVRTASMCIINRLIFTTDKCVSYEVGTASVCTVQMQHLEGLMQVASPFFMTKYEDENVGPSPRTWVAGFGMTDAASSHTTMEQTRTATHDMTAYTGLAGSEFHLCDYRHGGERNRFFQIANRFLPPPHIQLKCQSGTEPRETLHHAQQGASLHGRE
jgi:hypothetical protein